MSILLDKLRKGREAKYEVGDYVLTARRPRDLDMVRARSTDFTGSILGCVVGWARKDGAAFTEVDLGIVGGEPHPLEFDAEACHDWLSDRMDLAGPLVEKVVESYAAHVAALGEAAKN